MMDSATVPAHYDGLIPVYEELRCYNDMGELGQREQRLGEEVGEIPGPMEL